MHHMKSFSQPELGKGWFFPSCFPLLVSIYWSCLVLQSALRGVIRQFYTHWFCLVGRFYPFCWNHHLGIKSGEICTLHLKGLPTHSDDSMASLIPEKLLGCWIPSMILVRTGLGCQMFSLKFIQHVDSFRPCKYTVRRHHSIQLFMHLVMAKGREHLCRFFFY